MDLRCAGALLALAACIASSAAAPTASNQTALDIYDGAPQGCYYNFQHYGEGDRIMTNEPCLNCTCHNRMLMCYLRVCPFTKPIGQDCSVEKRADQCCPIVTCPDVPVDLLTSTSTTSPAEYGETGLGKLDKYGCSINGKYFSEGSKVPPSPNKPCEHCYCIRNMTTCVMQECTLHVDGCTPIYRKDVCCPVRYSCDHPEDTIPLLDDMTTTVRPTPGFLLTTTTTLSPVTQATQDCVHDDKIFADGALIKTEKACEHCYCMKGDIVCVVQECGTPMENEGKNCTSMPPREGQCCPDTYICEGDESITESSPEFGSGTPHEDVTTLNPPRRVSVEGSGYRNEPDEPFTEVPTFEPDMEGSGEEQEPFKPIDTADMFIPERETSPPIITTEEKESVDQFSSSTPTISFMGIDITEKATTEPDKGENTVPSGNIDENITEVSVQDETTPQVDKMSPEPITTTESHSGTPIESQEDASSIKDTDAKIDEKTPETIPADEVTEDSKSPTLVESTATISDELTTATEPTRRAQEDQKIPSESSTQKNEDDNFITTSSDYTVTTESSIFFPEQGTKTSTSQLPEQENEVVIKETSTESNIAPSTQPDDIKAETESAATMGPEVATEFSTSGKDRVTETTFINPVDNEIDEDTFSTPAPGRIPGEGDCLLDGVTYSNESIVPSTNNCHTSCRCISSIVKCDPIICSPPPDYMDNCQPMYDPPESCCPTYVCDHTKETVPPQPHSQMSGTESPIPTPTIECDGDQCGVSKGTEESAKPIGPCASEGCSDDSSQKIDDCGIEGCFDGNKKPNQESAGECTDEKCTSLQEPCTDEKCEPPIAKDQACDSEHGCKLPIDKPCQGEECKIHTDVTPSKGSPVSCDSGDGCKDAGVSDRIPDCEGESCVSGIPSKAVEKEDCKDGSGCIPQDNIPSAEECKEEECRKQQVPDVSKPSSGECKDAECLSQENIPATSAPAFDRETAPKATDLPITHETKPEESVTDLPKTTNVDKDSQSSDTTEAVNLSSPHDDESEFTPHYDQNDYKTETEKQPSVTDSLETGTQPTAPASLDILTTTATPKENTALPSEDTTKEQDITSYVTPKYTEETSTNAPKTDEDTEIKIPELPDIPKTELPDSVTTSQEPTTHVEEHEITTVSPSLAVSQDMHTDNAQETTEPQQTQTAAPEQIDKDTTANDTEYKKEQDVIVPSTISPSAETEQPEVIHKDSESKITDSTEIYTNAPIQITTDKDEQELENTFTTPKSYDTETRAPEGQIDSSTTSTVEQSTTSEKDEQKETVLPVSTVQSEETTQSSDVSSITENITPDVKVKPDITDATFKPETSPGDGDITQTSKVPDFSDSDTYTDAPLAVVTEISDIGTESFVTQPQELTTKLPETTEGETQQEEKDIVDIHKAQTEAPMSSVKDDKESEATPTQISETDAPTSEQELNTKKPEKLAPEPSSTTEIYEPEETPTEKPSTSDTEKEIEKMPSVSDVATEMIKTESESTVSPLITDKPSSEQSVQETESTNIPVLNTDDTAVTVSIVGNQESSEPSEPSVTEAGVDKTGSPLEHTTEIEITKLPESFTELPTEPTSEEKDSVSVDEKTEIPELTIHEHDDSTLTTEEPEKAVTEESSTKAADADVIDILNMVPEKIGTETPEPQDTTSKSPELLVTESQKEDEKLEASVEPQEVSTNIPETPSSELQKEVTDTPDTYDISTKVSETPTGSEKEVPKLPEVHDMITNVPVSVTELPMEVSKEPVSQDSATKTPEYVTIETQKEVTQSPELQDISTKLPDITEEQQYTKFPEVSETESQQEVTKTPVEQDITTSGPEIPVTESQPDVSRVPETQETSTNIPESSVTVQSQKDNTEIPKPQDAITVAPEDLPTETQTEVSDTQDDVTSVPKIPVTEPQENASIVPELQSIGTDIPKVFETQPPRVTTESLAGEDLVTIIPETVTEMQPEVTEIPVIKDTVTKVMEVPTTEIQKDVTESVFDETVTDIPKISITESEKEPTASPEIVSNIPDVTVTQQGVSDESTTDISHVSELESDKMTTVSLLSQNTNVPEISVTEANTKLTMAPEIVSKTPDALVTESQEVTESSEVLEKEPQKETTEVPVVSDDTTSIPEVPVTDKLKEVTDALEAVDIITKVPEVIETEPQKEDIPEVHVTTSVPEVSITELHTEVTEAPEKEVTEIPKITEMTEPQDTFTKIPEISESEPSKKFTEELESNDITTSTPDLVTKEPHKEVTEQEAQEFVTKQPERTYTEAIDSETKADESMVTEIEENITESSPKETIKLEEPTVNEQQEIITPTESSKIDYDSTQPTEDDLIKEHSTKLPESLVTEFDKTTVSSESTNIIDDDQHKPKDDEKEYTQMPVTDSTKLSDHTEPEKLGVITESSISSEPVELETKPPQSSEVDRDVKITTEPIVTEERVTEAPESEPVSKITESSSPSFELESAVTQTSEQTESDEKITKSSEELDKTSQTKDEYPETTTPYLVFLEEHTHKKEIHTISPDEEITTGPSNAISDYEPSTSEVPIEKLTESAPTSGTEKPPEEETLLTNKDQSVQSTEATTPEKITEATLVSKEITTTSPTASVAIEDMLTTKKPQDVESNEISTATPTQEQDKKETDEPSPPSVSDDVDKEIISATEKPQGTIAPEDEFIFATTRPTSIKPEEEVTIPALTDKFGEPEETLKPVAESEKPKPEPAEELPKPGINEIQTTEETPQSSNDGQFPPSGTSGYGQEPDYGEDDQAFGPGTCRYGGKVYVSAQQIPRDDPCDFCFCFRSDIICLQQSCPPPIHGCHEEPIQGFCCPRYECPVSMATTLNVTTTTTTTTTTLPPHFLPHAYKGAAQRRGCQIKGHTYKVGEVVRASSGPCLHCTCGGDGQMKCDPKVCTPEPMLRQMIAAAVSAKRRR